MASQPKTIWTRKQVLEATDGHQTSDSRNDWSAEGVSIDSRACNPGDLFVALSGPKFDGHDYIDQALANGAVAAIASKVPENIKKCENLILVKDTESALNQLGDFARKRSRAKIVAVTGSVGKTMTKDGLSIALGATGLTHSTDGNLNNHYGAPLTLSRLPESSAYAAIELGMNHAGELHNLSKLIRPNIAIITTIEAVHLEFFDSIASIAEAKAEVFAGLTGEKIAILNRDNAYFAFLASLAEDYGVKRIIGFGADPEADIRLLNIKSNQLSTNVTADINGKKLSYTLKIPGRHNIINSLSLLAAVSALNANVDKAAEALINLSLAKGRGRRHRITTPKGELTVIDDSYNASPASMRAAFETLRDSYPEGKGRRVAVLGDMLELGKESFRLHERLAVKLEANGIDQVYTVGKSMAALHQALPKHMRAKHAERPDVLIPEVKKALQAGDIVLIKGSQGSNTSSIANALIKNSSKNSRSLNLQNGEAGNAL
ncbi:MAG: UDP-N-acetylmuramoyl-tripeptide--D-alanyl-D-alanine ligase [Alphaproteobacteria bacterium]|nr:UDP-N-acetylmuramoyl-tripeptide--D-alanyl-D-alanine ligase [Alphaproteobacteria bacterium]|tara:strand:+ start:574 stop:2043 length:1470 start_codon:yes stop_codon:yes gene_type:complete